MSLILIISNNTKQYFCHALVKFFTKSNNTNYISSWFIWVKIIIIHEGIILGGRLIRTSREEVSDT